MPGKSYHPLAMHKADCCNHDSPLDWGNRTRLREQLLQEIRELDCQLETLAAGVEVDFSLQQTCREMIHERQLMYKQLQ